MKSRKIVAIGLACVLALSISACSSNVTGPTESEDVSQVPDASTSQVVSEAIETATFEVKTEEETEADKAEETEASSEAEEVEETEAVEVEETKAEEVTPATTKEPETEKAEPVHTHSYTSSVTKEATCDTNGTKTYECSCGDSYTEAIQATGHTYDNGKVVKEATCTEAGGKVFTCTKCGAVYTEAISAHGHNNVTTEATGHIEQVQVGTKWVEDYATVIEYECGNCHWKSTDREAFYTHIGTLGSFFDAPCPFGNYYTTEKKVANGGHEEPVYENKWVEDAPATTICSTCGQRQ